MHRLLQINDAIRSVPFMTSEESQAYLAQQRARVQEFERQKTRRCVRLYPLGKEVLLK